MPATINPAAETASQRSSRTIRSFGEALGLKNLKAKDLTLLAIALAEVATDKVQSDSGFAEGVRHTFQKFAATTPIAGTGKQSRTREALVPIGPVDLARLSPHGPLDPFALYTAYGSAQARRVLSDASLEDLKQSAAIVEQRYPGTMPPSRRAKAPLIAYITEHMGK